MARYNVNGRPLPESAKDQFLIHLYGYLAQNGCSESARALAKEARFAANHYPLLDFLDDWWSQLLCIRQELEMKKMSFLAAFREPPSASSGSRQMWDIAEPSDNTNGLPSRQHFRVPFINKNNLQTNMAARAMMQPSVTPRKENSVQNGVRPSNAYQDMYQQQDIESVTRSSGLGQSYELLRERDQQTAQNTMQALLAQEQQKQLLQQRMQQQLFQQQQQQQLILLQQQLQQQQLQQQLQQLQQRQQLQPQLQLKLQPKLQTKIEPEMVSETSDSRQKPRPSSAFASQSRKVEKTHKSKQAKLKSVRRKSGSQVKPKKKTSSHLPLQEVALDHSNPENSFIQVKLQSHLPILLPGQEPLKVQRRDSQAKRSLTKNTLLTLGRSSLSGHATESLTANENTQTQFKVNYKEVLKQNPSHMGLTPLNSATMESLQNANSGITFNNLSHLNTSQFGNFLEEYPQNESNFGTESSYDALNANLFESMGVGLFLNAGNPGGPLTSKLDSEFSPGSAALGTQMLKGSENVYSSNGIEPVFGDNATLQSGDNNLTSDPEGFNNIFSDNSMALQLS